ncbi:hypothetical protein KP509_38G047500 [Ceratopteris richardii]|nr:hypothetical protein KP509_38G047500 [Ceratopteris richardii]
MFRQEQFLPPLNQNIDIPGTITSTQRCEELLGQNQPLSINNIMLMLENDKLDEDELFTLLVGSCTKSSASSSPLSSTTEVSNVRSSSSSSSSSSMPLSSTSLLQLPTSPTAYSLTLPYSLSLPSSCKMSPDASFEFTAKSSGSTPSTPVFSSINSKARRSNIHLKPSSLTSDDFIDIWGVFEQRQVLISEKHA